MILVIATVSHSQATQPPPNQPVHEKIINGINGFGKKVVIKIREWFRIAPKAPANYVVMDSIEMRGLSEIEKDTLPNGAPLDVGLKLFFPRITPSMGYCSFQLGNYEYFKYVNGVSIDDIEYIKLIDSDGNECEVDKFEFVAKERARNYAFLLDHSGSMGNYRASELQQAMSDASLKQLRSTQSTNLSVFKFSVNNQLIAKGNSIQEIRPALVPTRGLDGFGGGTAIKDAMLGGIEHLSQLDDEDFKLLVLFTDGITGSDTTQLVIDDVVELATKNNINIASVGFGNNVDAAYLRGISRLSGGNFYHIYEEEEFPVLFDNLFREVELSYDLEFVPCLFGNNVTLEIALSKNDNKYVGQTVFRTPISKGYGIDLDIVFDLNSSKVKPRNYQRLDSFVHFLESNSTVEILVEGHSDRIGKEEDNVALSLKRAESVKEYLTRAGIDESRIATEGLGSSKPAFPYLEGSDVNPNNRRIQVVIVSE